ncbi:MAG TPA: DNA alkylation repair protein [Polyangia bacterium]
MTAASPKALDVQTALAELSDAARAKVSQRFFKTAPGQYGAGDRFRGIRVPALRELVGRYAVLSLPETRKLLMSPYHEDRLLALLILVRKYTRGTEDERATIYNTYLASTHFINNWDLVDSSAPYIVGAHLQERDRAVLSTLARSSNLWERRIAILATLAFIRRDDFGTTVALAQALLGDPEDLIHKAVGWMLREMGNRDAAALERFLRKHHARMPRTMLRYAIEKFPEARRKAYLAGAPPAAL